MSLAASYTGDFGIVLGLYGLKALLLRSAFGQRRVLAFFTLAVCLALPAVWAFSPDWDNPQMLPIGKWLGAPIAVLTVPCCSFLVDYLKGWRTTRSWYIRIPLEVFIGVPVWAYIWALICFYVLGWVWV